MVPQRPEAWPKRAYRPVSSGGGHPPNAPDREMPMECETPNRASVSIPLEGETRVLLSDWHQPRSVRESAPGLLERSNPQVGCELRQPRTRARESVRGSGEARGGPYLTDGTQLLRLGPESPEVPAAQNRIASLLAFSHLVTPLLPGASPGRRDRSQPAQFIVKAAKSDDQQREQGHRRQRVPGIGVLRGDQQ